MMAWIAEEAERQGFQVRQARSGMWIFRRDGNSMLLTARTIPHLFQNLSVLISAGLDWSHWDLPEQYDRDE